MDGHWGANCHATLTMDKLETGIARLGARYVPDVAVWDTRRKTVLEGTMPEWLRVCYVGLWKLGVGVTGSVGRAMGPVRRVLVEMVAAVSVLAMAIGYGVILFLLFMCVSYLVSPELRRAVAERGMTEYELRKSRRIIAERGMTDYEIRESRRALLKPKVFVPKR